MTGWVVKSFASAPEDGFGEILGADGLIYHFKYDGQREEFKGAEIKSYVSFSVFDDGIDEYGAVIEGFIDEAREEYIARLDREIEKNLSKKRYLHTFRVAKIAVALAKRFGGSERKAETAGLMHDAAKENTMDENREIIKNAGMVLAGFELNEHSILHAAAGAVVAKEKYGIEDKEILNAVRYHNGRPAMKPLEKIIFLADHLDFIYKNRVRSGNDIIREKDIDRAIFKMITVINQVLVRGGNTADAITESTMNYMFVRLSVDDEQVLPTKDVRTPISDALFDRALEISSQRGLALRSVKNIRDLGGIKAGERTVKRGKLIRSARLSELTEEDAKKLAGAGVKTIIDLRSKAEAEKAPNMNVEGFETVRFPLPTLELTEYQKNVQEKFFLTDPGAEKAYYLTEYLSCIDMKDLYTRIITEKSAIESLKGIFGLLCSSDGGFLFHCSDGKDRTGVVAALILLALGASKKDILEDYYTSLLATFSETEAYAQSLRVQHYSEDYIDEIRYCNGIGMNIAESVSDELAEKYGSAENYLKSGIITEEQIKILKEKYSESRADAKGEI